MSEALEVAAALGAAFPSENTVAAMAEGSDELATLQRLSWPDFDIAMVGSDPAFRLETKGIDGLIDAWRDWLSPFETYRIEIEGLEDAGDRALILVRQVATPRGTEAAIENPGAAVVWMRDGKLSRVEFHMSRDEARRAAGLA
jgi:ketosteroid isomerase-like protein